MRFVRSALALVLVLFVVPAALAAETFTWSMLQQPAKDPTPREDHAMAFDRARRRFVVFGGFDDQSIDFLDETWAYHIDRPFGWQAVTPAGDPPPGRVKPGLAFDPLYDRLVVFGGSGTGDTDFDDLWFLTFSPAPAWRQVVAAGAERPSGRWGGSFVYDSRARSVLLFGGKTIDGNLDDLWQLNLGPAPAWERLAVLDPKPSARALQATAYDSVGAQMIVFGGHDGAYRNDVWALRNDPKPRWVQLQPDGPAPSPRVGATLVLDGVRRRALLFGGWDGAQVLNDTWELRLEPKPAWTLLATGGIAPSPRVDHAAIFDPVTRRMLTFGGFDQATRRFGEVWQLAIAEPAQVAGKPGNPKPVAVASTQPTPGKQPTSGKQAASGKQPAPGKQPAVATAPAAPMKTRQEALVLSVTTPKKSKLDVSWSLPRDGLARIEMFDWAGKRQWAHDVDRSGTFSVPNVEKLKAGTYFVRVTQGSESRVVSLAWQGR
jgi:hypothetical protein